MLRRFLISLIVLVVLVVVAVAVGDHFAQQTTESQIAKRIEQRVPGSHATVTISSQPFLYHLAAAGTVEVLHAHVTGVKDSGITFTSIDVTVNNLQVNRSDLLSGSVHLSGISNAIITATLPATEVAAAGLASLGSLGSGRTATVQSQGNHAQIKVAGTTIDLPYNTLVPCVGSATVKGTNLVVTCTTTTLPPALAQAS